MDHRGLRVKQGRAGFRCSEMRQESSKLKVPSFTWMSSACIRVEELIVFGIGSLQPRRRGGTIAFLHAAGLWCCSGAIVLLSMCPVEEIDVNALFAESADLRRVIAITSAAFLQRYWHRAHAWTTLHGSGLLLVAPECQTRETFQAGYFDCFWCSHSA